MKYRKKPVVVDAWVWDESHKTLEGTGARQVAWDGHFDQPDLCRNLRIETLEGTMNVRPGDYIIKGVQGEFYPCKPDIFAATYEPVQETNE